ncbi:RHS repeat-associated core domain-containing protein [Longispora albida]|uniref:RHS repeat-associated core domain-containing protein n=1 Tax=Longispora albida TaxID=203523 RepID=UPI0003A3B901|nr:RHS repeat-associated core domain-containing protein [Longispora albida]
MGLSSRYALARAGTRLLQAGLAAAMAASLLPASPALAAPKARYQPGSAQKEKPVAGRTVKPGQSPQTTAQAPSPARPPVWPAAGTAEISLDGAGDRTAGLRSGAARAGDLPIWVEPAGQAPKGAAAAPSALGTAGKLRLQVLDRAATTAAGANGMVFRATTDGAGTQAKVTVDYSAFRGGYGGDWAGRLRLYALPECALTTPAAAGCQGKPVEGVNNVQAGSVTATLSLPGADSAARSFAAAPSGGLFALSAGASGTSGSYAATPLASSSSWSAGGAAGDFSWSYPLRVPPAAGGPAPSIAFGYSSASVDGRMAASNNQPSEIGEGFDWSAGYIERRYVPCSDDMAGNPNNTSKTSDLCWVTDNATLSMPGRGGELIKDPNVAGRWRLRADDGSYVERKTGNGNGDNDGEHWVVTTPTGVQYWFGRAAQSTLTVPVFGNHSGEPCRLTTYNESWCAQAWRWNLDYVVDTHGNTMSYTYAKETNKYGRNGTPSNATSYDRASYLSRIEYGTRTDVSGSAPARVEFGYGDRCLSSCGTRDAAHWPDTPWDQDCQASSCQLPYPSFWTTRRLATVTTQVWGGSAYRNVDSWTLTHSFPDPGDGTRAGLWLQKIGHTGHVGGTATLPDISFTGIQLANRVDTIDHSPAMNWWRIKTINTESGGKIDVTYSAPECVAGSNVPDKFNLQDNIKRCYPVKWIPQGYTSPVIDFFHKYVVTDVIEADLTGGSPLIQTHYDYLGAPAWHYTDDDGLIKADSKNWSVWRGYGAVRTTKGDAGQRTSVETRYFRGMHGDKLPSGTRSVQLPAAGTAPAVNDEAAFSGQVREVITYNGPGGAEVSAEVHEPWQSPPTATRTINGTTVHARFLHTGAIHYRAALDKGRPARTTITRTVYDDTYGMELRSEDLGEPGAGDEKCSISDYARSTSSSRWIVATVSRVRAYATDCAKALAGTGITADDVLSDDLTYYDGQGHGAAPTKGDVTRTDALKEYNGAPSYLQTSTATYDDHGRPVVSANVKGNTIKTAYTPAKGGPVTGTTVTDPMGWNTVTTIEPAWGHATSTVDSNGRRTEMAYDGLGNLTAVWQPGRDRGTQDPSMRYTYLFRNNAPSVVKTEKLNQAGGYIATRTFYDSLLRARQTQIPDAAGGPNAVVTDTYYDSVGRVLRENSAYLSTVAPGDNLFIPSEVIPAQNTTLYDGAGRKTATVLMTSAPSGGSPGGTEKWRTSIQYSGDRVDTIPPRGGVVSSNVTDAGGRVREIRQYDAGVAAGSDTGFTATRYTYNRKNQLTELTGPSGLKWTYEYDMRGRKVKTIDPDKGTSTSAYGDGGELLTSTDARGVTLTHTYDKLNRKTGLFQGPADTGTKLAEWTYDVLSSGNKVNGKPVKTIRYSGGAAYTSEVTGYTIDYKPTGTKIVVPDTETGLNGTYSYVYTYNQDGSQDTVRIPAAGGLKTETLTYGYNALGQPVTLSSNYGTSLRTSLVGSTSYTSFGEVGAYTLQNNGGNTVDVVRTYETDTRRISQIWTSKQAAPTTVADVRYTYDPAGNVEKISDLTASDTQCFRVDNLQRLKHAWTPASGDCAADPGTGPLGGAAPYWQSFGYDAAGNRAQKVEHGLPGGDRTTSYTLEPGKHGLKSTTTTYNGTTTTAAYGVDELGGARKRPSASGEQTLTWDAEGRLASSSDTTGLTSYLYDPEGSRMIRNDPKGKTLYLPMQELRYNRSDGTVSASRYYSHTGSTIAVRNASGLTWISADHLGTAQITVGAQTQAVAIRRTMPFGEVRGGTGTWPSTLDKGFVGGTEDNTGLTHLGAREYDPGLGRFISADPLFESTDPQSLNGYAYAHNNPVTLSDPSGLSDNWVYVGTQKFTKQGNGWIQYWRVDYYVLCGNGGCSGGFDRYGNMVGLWLLDITVITVRTDFVGPVAASKHAPPQQRAPQPERCLAPPPAPEPPKKPKCDFWELKCLVDGRASDWWRGNKDWVTGGLAVAGMAACILATAGTCAVVGAIGWGVSSAGRIYDFVDEERYKSAKGWAALGGGLAIDAVAAKVPGLPGVRLETQISRQLTRQAARNGTKAPTRTMGWGEQFRPGGVTDWQAVIKGSAAGSTQVAWTAVSTPASAPWNKPTDNNLTDPYKWTPQNMPNPFFH